MRSTKEFRAAREAIRREQQLLHSFVSVDEQFFSVFNRFHGMTKKLCGPLTQR